MVSISKWCDNNKMVINTNKTKGMLIGSRQRRATLQIDNILKVTVGDTTLHNVTCEKLLGVKIDHNLSWNDHVDYICNVISSRLALLRRIKTKY